MPRPPTPIVLTQLEEQELRRLTTEPKMQRRFADRARMILKAAAGQSNLEIAAAMAVRPATVCKWRVRFENEGLEGLRDDFRPGRPPTQQPEDLRAQLLSKLDEEPPSGYLYSVI